MKNRIAIFGLLLTCASAASSSSLGDDRFYELRTYFANEGKLDALHARFRDHTMGLFTKHGMTNIGYWVPKENKNNRLVYLMAYPNREKRDEMWEGFLNDPDWKKAYAASTENGKLVKEIESLFLKATDYSPELKMEVADPKRLFELRVYTTNSGKLEALHARFRDHTMALFKKHGVSNLAYFEPVKGQPGEGIKLVYFLTHRNEASRKLGFKSFFNDPAWKKARDESETNGKLLVKKGVAFTLLRATDYSPMQ